MKKLLRKNKKVYKILRFFYYFFINIKNVSITLCVSNYNVRLSAIINLVSSDIKILNVLFKKSLLNSIKDGRSIDLANLEKLSSFFYLTGRRNLGLIYLRKKLKILSAANEKNKWNNEKFRIISAKNFGAIGHIAYIDCFIKSDILGITKKKKNILFDKDIYFSNQYLIELLSKYFHTSIKRINNNYIPLFHQELNYIEVISGKKIWFDEWAYLVQRKWIEKSGLKSLLNENVQERLKTISFLNTFGFSKNDWFVTIHLREDGGGQMRGIRNIKPETYIPAIKYIIERGGWVFKIGSAGIKSKINLKTKKFIDFSSIDFNPFLDIFLISNCRFFIGTGSGPINIASQIFCKPILLTNAGPLLSRVPWPFQLVIPKMYLSNKTNKVMGLSERLNNKIGTLESTNALSELGYSLIDNNHEIIKDACNEMMEITSVNGYKFDILLKNDNQILFRKILNDKKGLCPIYCSSMLLETYPEFLKY